MEHPEQRLFLCGTLVIASCATYTYQIPYKKYVAEKEFYELLKNEYGLKSEDSQIIHVIKDVKSVRGGVSIRFTVRKSPLVYDYDYSVKKKDWMRGYVEDGVYHSTDKIIFEEE